MRKKSCYIFHEVFSSLFRFVYPYFFEIKDADGQVAARLNLTQGPFNMTWVKTKTNDKGQVVYVTNDKVGYDFNFYEEVNMFNIVPGAN